MTSEEMKEMNIKQVAKIYLSNECGNCCVCEFSKNISIGGVYVPFCWLMCVILREDRKQYILVQQDKSNGILGKV